MTTRASGALEALEHDVHGMSELVAIQLDSAIAALLRRDVVIADEVVRGDDEIDELDVKIERAGLSVLVGHSLRAEEVRLVVALIRTVTQLERVGDLAVNLAERAVALAALPPLAPFEALATMATRVQTMVRLAFVALATREVAVAERVLGMDALVDELHRGAFAHFEELMRADPETVERAVLTLSCSRYLERAGDHAKNVAGDLIWIIEGRTVRHAHHVAPREKILIGA